jgi:hypothetical protein
MEVGNFDQAELDKAIAAFSVTAAKYIGALDQSGMTRCRQLLVESLLISVTAMHEHISVMSLMMVQAQDHGHKQGRNSFFRVIADARKLKGGVILPEIQPMKEHTKVFVRNEMDRPLRSAAQRVTEARVDLLQEQHDRHMPSDESVAGADDTAQYATGGLVSANTDGLQPNEFPTILSPGGLINPDTEERVMGHVSIIVENCDCDGASMGCSGACKESKLGTDPLIEAIRDNPGDPSEVARALGLTDAQYAEKVIAAATASMDDTARYATGGIVSPLLDSKFGMPLLPGGLLKRD